MAESGRRLTSLADVAQRAGVSVATASRVLSNSSYPVASETRQRVLDAAADLDFSPNLAARSLVAQRTSVIGLVVEDISTEHAGQLARGVEDMATENGFAVLVRSTDGDPQSEISAARQFRSVRTDAVIYGCSSACHGEDEEGLIAQLRRIEEGGGVLIRIAPHPRVAPDVSISMHQALSLSLGHLAELGHRRIAFLLGDPESGQTMVALHAKGEILGELDLEADPAWCHSTALNHDGGRRVALALVAQRLPCTAVVAIDDTAAIGLLRGLADAGVDVPADISVVGMDDIPAAAYASPALTTVRVPLRALGQTAMQTAIWLLGGGTRMGRNNLPVELVARATTAAAPPSTVATDGGRSSRSREDH